MPRSSFSHNPLLRVSRPVSACSRCRNAKVKCDGKLPACTACEKAGRENECSAANDNFARGKERSYVAALELRIEKLEKRLAYAKSFKASVTQHDDDSSHVKSEASTVSSASTPMPDDPVDRRDSLAAIRAAVHRKAAKDREAADVNDIVSDFGFLTINATVRDFDTATTNLTFARFVLAAATNNALPDASEFVLPPRQVSHSIVQFYMANVYSLFPCVAETVVLTALDDLYSHDERVMSDADFWLVYVVLAIGSAAQSRRLDDEHYTNGVKFMSKALDYADQSLALGSLTQLRSLILLTIYSTLDPAHYDSWHLVGFAARATIDLGYHQDPRSSTVSDSSNLEMRRKLFYCVYALDRDISMVHAKAFSFTDESTNVAFPKSSSQGRKESLSTITGPQSSDPALMLFQLRRAQSYWYQELYLHRSVPLATPIPYLWQMCLEMREWGESLPESLPAGIRKMFEQELTYSYVYCLSPSPRVPHTMDYNRCLVFEYTQQYLNNMHEIAHTESNIALYSYHDALKVLFTANQLLGVLREAESMLLDGRWPSAPAYQPGQTPPPRLPRLVKGASDVSRTSRALSCLEKVSQTLGKFAERWDAVGLLQQGFQAIGQDVMDHLKAKQNGSVGDTSTQTNVQWTGDSSTLSEGHQPYGA